MDSSTIPASHHGAARPNGVTAADDDPVMPDDDPVAPISLDDRLRELETRLIRWALAASGGNKSRAARLLNVKRSTLGDRINRCGLGSHR